MANPSKILLIGATGLLGSHLVRALLAEGHTNLRALRRTTSDLTQIADIADQIEWVEGDILDVFSLEDAMQGVEKVYHCAAMISYQPRDAAPMRKVNVEGTANVVNSALEKGVKRLIYVSSIAAIGENKKEKANQPITEKTTWERSPHNSDYSISKYLAEQEVWRAAAEGLEVAIVNPSIILGYGDWRESSTTLFRQVWKGLKFYPVGTTGYVDVKDVARFMVLLLESAIVEERYILNGANLRFQDFFNQVADALHKKRPTYAVRPWLANVAWRIGGIYAFLTGNAPMLTQATAYTSAQKRCYDNSKSLNAFSEFAYTPIEETIKEVATRFLKNN
jgi:dihydroflavonol-4-reductase